jgi:predicted MFS family arabinose efflux permease
LLIIELLSFLFIERFKKGDQLSEKNNLAYKTAFFMIFIPFAIGFILSCLFRTMNAVLSPELEKSIAMPVSALGFLTSVYFLAYALFQIPLGTLLDRFGSRKVQSCLFVIAAIGLFYFSQANHVYQLAISHALIGIGMAGGLMAAFKIIVQWFKPDQIMVLNGIMMMFGGAGILLSATPTEYLAKLLGWQHLVALYGVITLAVALFIFLFVPDTDTAIEKTSLKTQLKEIIKIYQTPIFWRIAPLVASILGSFMAIQALWIEGWMRDVNHLSQKQIDNYLLLIGIALTISLLGTGFIAKWMERYSITMLQLLEFFAVLFFIDQALIIFNIPMPQWLVWFMYGFLSHKFNLCYAIFAKYFPKTHTARANAALNVMTFFVVFSVQYLIGIIINHWHEIAPNHYPIVAWQTAFSFAFILQILGFIWYIVSPRLLKNEFSLQQTKTLP